MTPTQQLGLALAILGSVVLAFFGVQALKDWHWQRSSRVFRCGIQSSDGGYLCEEPAGHDGCHQANGAVWMTT